MQLIFIVLEAIPYEGDGLIAAYDNQEAADNCAAAFNKNPYPDDSEYHVMAVPLQTTYTPLTQ